MQNNKNLTVYIADKWAESDINSNDSAISIFDMYLFDIYLTHFNISCSYGIFLLKWICWILLSFPISKYDIIEKNNYRSSWKTVYSHVNIIIFVNGQLGHANMYVQDLFLDRNSMQSLEQFVYSSNTFRFHCQTFLYIFLILFQKWFSLQLIVILS